MSASVVARRDRAKGRPLAGRVFGLFTPYLNGFVARVAGRRFVPMWSLLHHRGRTSGAAYATPITAFRVPGGFAIGLAFGPGANWVRNVLAAERATLRWRGREYPLIRPSVIDVAAPSVALEPWKQTVFRALGVDRVLLLLDDADARPAAPTRT
jgi:deazaflavin-dependent oxidoreductase (nitroreductase family)